MWWGGGCACARGLAASQPERPAAPTRVLCTAMSRFAGVCAGQRAAAAASVAAPPGAAGPAQGAARHVGQQRRAALGQQLRRGSHRGAVAFVCVGGGEAAGEKGESLLADDARHGVWPSAHSSLVLRVRAGGGTGAQVQRRQGARLCGLPAHAGRARAQGAPGGGNGAAPRHHSPVVRAGEREWRSVRVLTRVRAGARRGREPGRQGQAGGAAAGQRVAAGAGRPGRRPAGGPGRGAAGKRE